jgi:hypothetical protein
MTLTAFPNGVSSFGIPVLGSGVPLSRGNYYFVDPGASDSSDGNVGTDAAFPLATIQGAVNKMVADDVVYISPATYAENVVVATAGLTFVGLGARGQPWINPATGIAFHVNAVDDIVVYNLGMAGASAAQTSLRLTSSSESRFYQCKIEGGDGPTYLALLEGTADAQCGNVMFEDCEFAWGTTGVVFDNSAYGYPTQIRFRNSLFHNITTVHMRDEAAGGGFADLWVKDCEFSANEDASEPTDYLLINRAGNSGIFSGNRFATATNAASTLTIAAGVLWMANATEAGWSTARPA